MRYFCNASTDSVNSGEGGRESEKEVPEEKCKIGTGGWYPNRFADRRHPLNDKIRQGPYLDGVEHLHPRKVLLPLVELGDDHADVEHVEWLLDAMLDAGVQQAPKPLRGQGGVRYLERGLLAQVVPGRASEALPHGRPSQEYAVLANDGSQDARNRGLLAASYLGGGRGHRALFPSTILLGCTECRRLREPTSWSSSEGLERVESGAGGVHQGQGMRTKNSFRAYEPFQSIKYY